MNTLLPLFRAEQAQALDRRAIQDFGCAGYTLMQRAAAAALGVLQEYWPQARRILFLAGGGNNGGDALDMARQAAAEGFECRLILWAKPEALRAEAAAAWSAFSTAGLTVDEAQDLEEALAWADVVVDGLLGVGLSRPLRSPLSEVVQAVNRSDSAVLALDVPTGINADTGSRMGEAIRADHTVSFIARKRGLYTGQALDFTGPCTYADLDLPQTVFESEQASVWMMDSSLLAATLPKRQRNAHKGHHGHVLLLGGAPQYGGAIRMAAMAALRSGAGLVSVLTHPDNVLASRLAAPEAMVLALDDAQAQTRWEAAQVLAIGPGLGRDAWARSALESALQWAKQGDRPLLLDADALHLLPPGPLPAKTILTPHPGEAAALLGIGSADVQADRFAAAQNLAQQRQAIVVLKGAGTLIAAPGRPSWLCPYGNPGMAVGGMGDVLSGVVAALLGQERDKGLDAFAAAALGVLAHSLAGDRAAERGERGLLPRDVIEELRAVLNP